METRSTSDLSSPAGGTYRGRFAPSPTGPLHFGSIVAAVASYADARAHSGQWLVRMEDVDQPRTVPGAADDILRTLERFGFEWDGEVLYQSERTAAYAAALTRLEVFGCACSRRDLQACRCRAGLPPGRYARASRVRSTGELICFDDRVQGRFCAVPDDFVVQRADGFFAYQLAVVVDDLEQGITDVVRGSDLLDSTPRQILLQKMLGCPPLRYLHVPVAVNRDGQKLSKQTLAPAVTPSGDLLRQVLRFLGQPGCDTLREAVANWSPESIPKSLTGTILPHSR